MLVAACMQPAEGAPRSWLAYFSHPSCWLTSPQRPACRLTAQCTCAPPWSSAFQARPHPPQPGTRTRPRTLIPGPAPAPALRWRHTLGGLQSYGASPQSPGSIGAWGRMAGIAAQAASPAAPSPDRRDLSLDCCRIPLLPGDSGPLVPAAQAAAPASPRGPGRLSPSLLAFSVRPEHRGTEPSRHSSCCGLSRPRPGQPSPLCKRGGPAGPGVQLPGRPPAANGHQRRLRLTRGSAKF